jgi:hypothetical protein
MLIYHIPPSRKRKRSRRALLPALLAGSVCVEAIDKLSESKKEHSSTPLLLMPSEKERSPTPSLLYSSESTKERSLILLPFLPVESADAPHVEAIVGLPKLMNKQAPIPLLHTKSAPISQVDPIVLEGSLHPIFLDVFIHQYSVYPFLLDD